MMCMVALMKDAVLSQRDDVHDSNDEQYCAEDSEMMCMIALMKDGCTEDSEMMCMVALLKDAVLTQ